MKLLLVEDSHMLQRSLSAGLTNSGMTVDQAFDGEEAERFLGSSEYDVVILDVMLPKLSGLDVLQRLRSTFEELLSRLRALRRRMGSGADLIDSQLTLGNITVNTVNRTVLVDTIAVNLTPSEYRILELLVTRKKQTFSHDALMDRLYRADQNLTRNAIEAHVSSLRRKMREAGAASNVSTRRGFGYYIE